jgi:hypothetical protein
VLKSALKNKGSAKSADAALMSRTAVTSEYIPGRVLADL